MHPVLGEIDPDEGPAVLDDDTSIVRKPIPPAFESPLIESKPPPNSEPIRKRLKRGLINLARKALDKLDDDKK
jgi:hypothetical protein